MLIPSHLYLSVSLLHRRRCLEPAQTIFCNGFPLTGFTTCATVALVANAAAWRAKQNTVNPRIKFMIISLQEARISLAVFHDRLRKGMSSLFESLTQLACTKHPQPPPPHSAPNFCPASSNQVRNPGLVYRFYWFCMQVVGEIAGYAA